MDDDLKAFYHHKKSIDYCGYKIVIFENTTVKSINKYIISVFQGSNKIGEVTTDNDTDAIRKIRAHIDKSEENGGRLVFIKP